MEYELIDTGAFHEDRCFDVVLEYAKECPEDLLIRAEHPPGSLRKGLRQDRHTVSLGLVDFDIAKEELLLMLRSLYAHPNGQIPAYEWNFSDANPPVHAWATLYLFQIEQNLGRGRPERAAPHGGGASRTVPEAPRADRALPAAPHRGPRARGPDGGGIHRICEPPPPLHPNRQKLERVLEYMLESP